MAVGIDDELGERQAGRSQGLAESIRAEEQQKRRTGPMVREGDVEIELERSPPVGALRIDEADLSAVEQQAESRAPAVSLSNRLLDISLPKNPSRPGAIVLRHDLVHPLAGESELLGCRGKVLGLHQRIRDLHGPSAAFCAAPQGTKPIPARDDVELERPLTDESRRNTELLRGIYDPIVLDHFGRILGHWKRFSSSHVCSSNQISTPGYLLGGEISCRLPMKTA